jgi:hypothetical protein
MNRRTVVFVAVLGGLAVAGGATIPMVSHARRTAEDNMRLERLRQIGGNLQLFAEIRTHGDVGWQSLVDQARAEPPDLLSPFNLGDGTLVTYEVVAPNESNRKLELSAWVVIRDVVHKSGRPSAALFGDGQVAFEK